MDLDLGHQLAALRGQSISELRTRYAELFGEPTRAANKAWLLKRLAWRLQMLAEGDLSERARRRAAELAHDADLRLNPPRPKPAPLAPAPAGSRPGPAAPDRRLPPPGSVLTRAYKGQVLHVQVLADGFALDGHRYPSLSAVAKAVTGSHCNGYLFFRLGDKGGAR